MSTSHSNLKIVRCHKSRRGSCQSICERVEAPGPSKDPRECDWRSLGCHDYSTPLPGICIRRDWSVNTPDRLSIHRRRDCSTHQTHPIRWRRGGEGERRHWVCNAFHGICRCQIHLQPSARPQRWAWGGGGCVRGIFHRPRCEILFDAFGIGGICVGVGVGDFVCL